VNAIESIRLLDTGRKALAHAALRDTPIGGPRALALEPPAQTDLYGRALLELADRLEALEARMDGPTPTTQHTYSLRPPLGDWQHQAIAQGPKQRSDP